MFSDFSVQKDDHRNCRRHEVDNMINYGLLNNEIAKNVLEQIENAENLNSDKDVNNGKVEQYSKKSLHKSLS